MVVCSKSVALIAGTFSILRFLGSGRWRESGIVVLDTHLLSGRFYLVVVRIALGTTVAIDSPRLLLECLSPVRRRSPVGCGMRISGLLLHPATRSLGALLAAFA